MTFLSSLAAEIRAVDAGYPALPMSVQLDPASSTGLGLDLDFTAGAADQHWPTRARESAGPTARIIQTVFARLSANVPGQGAVVTTSFIEGFEVATLAGDQAGQRWRFVVPAQTEDLPHGFLGWEKHYLGDPPPGQCGSLSLDIVYVTDLGVEIVHRVLENGIPSAGLRSIEIEDERSRKMRHTIEISGAGPEFKLDRTPVTYLLDPMHGKTHGTMIREVGALATLTDSDFEFGAELGAALDNKLEAIQESAWSLMKEIARGAGYWLVPRGSVFRAVEIAPQGEPVVTFTAADLVLTGGFQVNSSTDRPTLVRVISSEIQRSPDSEGTVTTIGTQLTYGPLTLRRAKWSQSNTPPYIVATGFTDIQFDLELVGKIERARTRVDGCETLLRTVTWRHRNWRAARYQTDTAGAINVRLAGWLLETTVVDGDEADLYVLELDRWMIDTVEEEVPTRDDDGRELTREKFSGRWAIPEEARKSHVGPGADWPSVLYTAGPVMADGRGALVTTDQFFGDAYPGSPMARPTDAVGALAGGFDPGTRVHSAWYSIETTERQADDANLLAQRSVAKEGHARRAGESYWYADGSTSRDGGEYGIIIERVVDTWSDEQSPEGWHDHTTTTQDREGSTDPEKVVVNTVEGGRPAIPICTQALIDQQASREIQVERSLPAGACRQVIEHEEHARFAETEDLATNLAERLRRWLTGTVLVFSVPCNAPLSDIVGCRARIDFPAPIDYTGDGWIEWVRHWAEIGSDGRPKMYSEIGFRWGWVA